MQETERFVAASAVLTGFAPAELAATGMAGIYREFVIRRVEPPLYSRMMDRLAGVDVEVHTALADDVALGELARAVCRLWYLGEWPASANDGGALPHLVSGRAYAGGLVWRCLGGHVPGVGRPGYGTWADAPAGDRAAGGGR
ncbi:hypothetical protein [Embleya sp. AB8]|uniref:hypothetical protein n=1 Tax=Embleya sp. AB8 TaxID=3156304 RepID=UPI003C767320